MIANAQETAQKNRKSFFMNVSYNLTMQPSKGLHNQVVKIVVPYCTARKKTLRVVQTLLTSHIIADVNLKGKKPISPFRFQLFDGALITMQ